MRFFKYHALGNDYLVLDPEDCPKPPDPGEIQVICHRNFGIGSDGILYGPLRSNKADFGLRIFNPDGGEAEKSGNGLRIFSRYLLDRGHVGEEPFTVDTPGGVVQVRIHEQGRRITVDMGRVSFRSEAIPVSGEAREVINETVNLEGRTFTFCAATIGNPHCVLPVPEATANLARTYGPALECHPHFPNRTNVQFLQVIDRKNIKIEIWERGAGYTLASGSSSSASAAVARRLGLVDEELTVHMPGGKIGIRISEDYAVEMTGPVTRVAEGNLDSEIFEKR